MAQFAPMMSPENSALGASADAASAGIRLATSLRTAAEQQQQLQAQKDKDAKADALKQWASDSAMRKGGYTVYDAPGENGRPSIMHAGDANGTPDPSRLTPPDPWGKQWVMPEPKAEKPEAGAQQTATGLAAALEHGGRPLDANGNIWQDSTTPRMRMDAGGNVSDSGMFGVHVAPPDESRVRQIPGGPAVYMPTEEQEDQRKAAAKQAAVPVKEEKAPKFTYNHFTDDAGRVSVTRIGADGVPSKWNGKEWAPLEAGAKLGPQRKDPNAAPAAKQATPAQLNAVEGKKRAALVRAEVGYKKAMKDATVGGYTDPDAAKAASDELLKGKQDAQDAYEAALTEFGKPVEHVEYSAESAAPAKAAAAGAGGGRVRVKLSDGRTGTVDPADYDPKTMRKL